MDILDMSVLKVTVIRLRWCSELSALRIKLPLGWDTLHQSNLTTIGNGTTGGTHNLLRRLRLDHKIGRRFDDLRPLFIPIEVHFVVAELGIV